MRMCFNVFFMKIRDAQSDSQRVAEHKNGFCLIKIINKCGSLKFSHLPEGFYPEMRSQTQ